LKEEIEKNNNFSKRAKIKNQNNEDQIKKYYTINLNCRKKNQKPIKFLQKVKEKKLKIKRIRINLENIIFCQWRFKDELKSK